MKLKNDAHHLKLGFVMRTILLIILLVSGNLLLNDGGRAMGANLPAAGISSNSGASYQSTSPELSVSSITLSPESPSNGDYVEIRAIIMNQGSEKARSVYLNLYANDLLLDTIIIDTIEADEAADAVFRWSAQYGTYALKVVIDEDNFIDETNETNNSSAIEVTTLVPDIVIESATWIPASPNYGENVTFTVFLKNQGEGRSSGGFILLLLNEIEKATTFFDPLDSGAQENIIFPHVMTETGDISLKLVADPYEAVYESDDSNNEFLAEMPAILPDLIVERVSWSPTNPATDESVIFSVVIKNQGRAESSTTLLHYDISTGVSDVTVDNIGIGASITKTFTWTAELGELTASLIIDPLDNITELDESNNEKEFLFSETRAADLTIEDISWSPAEPVEGEELTFIIQVNNQGIINSAASDIAYYINDEYYSSGSLGSLIAGGNQTASFTWTVRNGPFRIKAIADYSNSVAENAENNNIYEKLFIFPIPPELVMENLNWAPRRPSAGQEITFSVTLKNESITKSGVFPVRFYIDGSEQGLVEVDSLDAAGVSTVTFVWIAEKGNHAVKAFADPFGKITESDEQNNELEAGFTVADSTGDSSQDNPVTMEDLTSDKGTDESVTSENSVTTKPDATETGNSGVLYGIGASGLILVLALLLYFLRRKGLIFNSNR